MSTKTSYTGVNFEEVDVSDSSLPSRKHESLWSSWVDNGWLLEILSLLAGCTLIVGLCLVLQFYNGQQVPRLGASMGAAITLNTITAIVGAAVQACFLYPVIECLSQLKWTWLLRRSRKLEDMQTFDAASRGAIGSLRLVFKLGFRTSASIGALLIIIAVVLTPFFQQLITIAPQRTPLEARADFASSPVARTYTSQYEPDQSITLSPLSEVVNGTFVGTPQTEATMPTGLRAAVEIGFYTQYGDLQPITPVCSTGNCTFASYQTLAVCSQVANITDLIVTYNATTSPSVAKTGLRLASRPSVYIEFEPETATGIFMNVSSVIDKQTLRFQNRSSAFADAIILAATMPSSFQSNVSAGPNGGPLLDYPPIAFEVLLEWCVINYTTVIENGIASTGVIQSTSSFDMFNSSDTGTNGHRTMVDTNLSYSWGGGTQQDLKIQFGQIFSGQIEDGNGDLYATSGYTQAIWDSLTSTDGSHQDGSNLGRIMNNIANSMTNNIRSIHAHHYQNGTGGNVTGIAYSESTIIVIRWHWITGPVVFAALAVSFVLLTIMLSSSRRSSPHAWRSSSLAMLAALDPDLQHNLSGLTTPAQLSLLAKELRVQLMSIPGESQWRVVPSAVAIGHRGYNIPPVPNMRSVDVASLPRPL